MEGFEVTTMEDAVKEGDRVLYGKYGGTEVKVNGEEVMILRSEDIYAVFE